jgi:hypothetical protein
MNDEELAKDLSLRMNPQPSSKAWENWDSDWKLSWLDIARRARELLCVNTLPLLTPEAEAVLKAAESETAAEEFTVSTGGNGAPEITARREDRRAAVRAYREARRPKPRWTPDHYGFIHGPDDIHLAVQNRPGEEPADAARRVARLLNDWLVPEPEKTDAS